MLIIEAAGPCAAAIKPNLAFYEALGADGMAALERIRARIPADIPVVIDAKRADIGSTAARHAVALFDRLGADAVTVNPYPGGEAIAPLLERDRPLRLRPVPDLEPRGRRAPEPRRRRRPGDRRPRRGRSTCGSRGVPRRGVRAGRSGSSSAPRRPPSCARSGPWRPVSASSSRGSAPRAARSSRSCATVRPPRSPAGAGIGRGLLVNVSRGISDAALGEPGPGRPSDPGERLAAAARDWASRLPVLP